MSFREACLPLGWYPRRKAEIEDFLKAFSDRGSARSVVAPHAGWYYSGCTAAIAVSALKSDIDTIVVIGGHLPAPPGDRNSPLLIAREDGVKTPLGVMMMDSELRDEFKGRLPDKIPHRSDIYEDNTVEVLLPMVHHFFPAARLLWLRFPSALHSYEAGKILFESAGKLRREIAVIASADLTHYGENYNFSPMGRGKEALDWVRNVNDKNFIDAVISGRPEELLEHALKERSTCSAGSVLGALGFMHALELGKKAVLLDYRTSVDASASGDKIPDSFVGYAAMAWN